MRDETLVSLFSSLLFSSLLFSSLLFSYLHVGISELLRNAIEVIEGLTTFAWLTDPVGKVPKMEK
jgi:hypothetical protein